MPTTARIVKKQTKKKFENVYGSRGKPNIEYLDEVLDDFDYTLPSYDEAIVNSYGLEWVDIVKGSYLDCVNMHVHLVELAKHKESRC